MSSFLITNYQQFFYFYFYKLNTIFIDLFFFKASLKRVAKSLFELNASDPPLNIEQLPDLRHKAATSAVTFGLLS